MLRLTGKRITQTRRSASETTNDDPPAATVKFRSGPSEQLQVLGPASPLIPSDAPSVPKQCSADRRREPPKKKKKIPTRHKWTGTTGSHARHLRSVGCVVNPPTPEDALQLRKWPTEGMHERPVWPDPRYEIPKPPASELEVSVHNSLHAVLAFVAQVGRIISEGGVKPSLDDEIGVTYTKDELKDLENLVINTGLLYCAVCCVSQEDLAEYINSMSVESALQWLEDVQ